MWIPRKVHFRQREQAKLKALRWEPLGEFKSSKAYVWGTVIEEGFEQRTQSVCRLEKRLQEARGYTERTVRRLLQSSR